MSIKRRQSSVVSSLPIITGLLCLFNFQSVNAGVPGDACALLTAPQISTALGASVGPGKPILPNHTTVCTWLERGVPEGTERNVSVSLMTPKSFEIGKTPMTGITKTPVSGLGDDAYFVEAHGMAAGLSVKKGDTCFQVRTRSNPTWFKTGKTPESEAKDQAVDRALALEILKKL
jgi:hypothetical protein